MGNNDNKTIRSRGGTWSRASLSKTNLKWTEPESNPALRGMTPATIRCDIRLNVRYTQKFGYQLTRNTVSALHKPTPYCCTGK